MGPSTGLEQSLLHLAGFRARSVKPWRGDGTQRCCQTRSENRRGLLSVERPGVLYFAIYELEGSIRVGEHRLRHDGPPLPANERPSGGVV